MTKKQRLFAEYYISNGCNALEAYRQAFNKTKESLNNKPSYPYTLLKEPEIAEYIEQRRQEIYESLNIDAIRVTQELADIAFADKNDEIYNTNAKLRALELLSKNLGLQTQKVENKDIIEVTLVEDE